MGAGFFCFVLFARGLGSDALGQLAFVMAFVWIAGNIADFGTNTALAKSLAEHRDQDPAVWFGNFLLVRLGLTLVTLVLGALVSVLLGGERLLPMLLGCAATPFMAARFFESLFQIFERPQYSVYTALVLGSCQISLCATALWLGGGLNGYMAAFAVSQLIYFSFAMFLSRALVVPRFVWRQEHAAALMRLALPMGVSALAIAFYTRADIFLLTYLRSSTEVGWYNAAYRLLDLSTAVAVTAALPLIPILTRRLLHSREDARLLCTELMVFVATVLLPVAVLVDGLSDFIMQRIYGEAFIASAPALRVFAWLFMAGAYSLMASSINLAAGNMRYNYWLAPLAGAVNIGLDAWLIPRHGIMGAAMGTAAGTLLTLAVVVWNVRLSVGNIHRAGDWLKLAVCGTVLHFALQAGRAGAIAPLLLVTACGLLYAGLAWRLGLVPVARLSEVLVARRARKSRGAEPA